MRQKLKRKTGAFPNRKPRCPKAHNKVFNCINHSHQISKVKNHWQDQVLGRVWSSRMPLPYWWGMCWNKQVENVEQHLLMLRRCPCCDQDRVNLAWRAGMGAAPGRKKHCCTLDSLCAQFSICVVLLKKVKWESNIKNYTLAGVAQWIECQPTNQRVAGLIATCLGCGPCNHTLMFLSLSFSLPCPV